MIYNENKLIAFDNYTQLAISETFETEFSIADW